ncbi:MAG: aminoacyltransferase [Bacilli bacterium]|jgi:serine/alanine adding enzyme|nr:aminoacyltransferase [Bacilli bacterium]
MEQYTFIENIEIKEYQSFIINSEVVSFMQDFNWASVKKDWKSFRLGLYHNKKLVAVGLLLIKKIIKGIYIGYLPRGFVGDLSDEKIVNNFTEGLKKVAKENHCYMIKIDPNFCFQETSISEIKKNEKTDIPIILSKNSEQYHKTLLAHHYKHKGYPKELSKTFQPRFHMMVPLIDKDFEHFTEEEFIKSYKRKIRDRIGNYHTKRGVFFEHTTDKKYLNDFMNIIKETEKRQDIHLRNKEYFEIIMNKFHEKAVLFFGKVNLHTYLNFLENNNGKHEEIQLIKKLIASGKDIMTLSAAFVIMPTNQSGIRISEYLYAGNQLLANKLQVSLGLVFEICKYSIEQNCSYCNLGGVDGNLNDHLSIFKSTFNPIVMEFAGEYDLPIKKYLYYPIEIFLPVLKKIYKIFIKK